MPLTKLQEGSLKELWTISLPLMLSSLSAMLMLFVDRLLLAHYSTEAHNAAVNATTLGWALIYGWIVLANISEVFVSQYNGANRKERLGEPVWQMIWLSLASIIFFLPLALWGGGWIYGNDSSLSLEKNYFELMMLFGPSFPLFASLCGFFVGQGKTRLITILAVVANVANAGLDVVLIFGIDGWIEPLGIKGAAIATSSCTLMESIALLFIFLNDSNRKNHGTGHFFFKFSSFWQCVRIGFPGAIFVSVELFGFAVFYAMMTQLGEKYITIVGICQSILILFYFFSEGINKGASTIAGNLIGAKRSWIIPKVLLAGLRLHILFFVVMLICFTLGIDLVVKGFLPQATPQFIASIHDSLMLCIFMILVYMFFEGIRFLLAGVLTAAGDTFFLLIGGSLSVWVLMVLPVYLIVLKGKAPVEMATGICVFYSMSASLIYFWRILDGKWKTIKISDELR